MRKKCGQCDLAGRQIGAAVAALPTAGDGSSPDSTRVRGGARAGWGVVVGALYTLELYI